MANTHSWDIGDIQVYSSLNGFDDVVFNYPIIFKGVSDTLLAIDLDGGSDSYGTAYYVVNVDLTPPDAGASDFIPFDSLTKQQLYDWGMPTQSITEAEIWQWVDDRIEEMKQVTYIENVVIKRLAS